MSRLQRHVHVAGFRGAEPSLAAVRALLDWLAEGIERSLRLRVEGRSLAAGTRPRWMQAAREIGVERLSRGSIDLMLQAPTVSELLRDHAIWSQPSLFVAHPHAGQTPVDLFSEAVHDAVRGEEDADTLDAPLLAHIATARTLVDLGAESIALPGWGESVPEVQIVPADLERIENLAAKAPTPRRTRVTGELDTVSVSTGAFVLLVDGRAIRGVMARTSVDALREMLGRRVHMEGELHYRPSGRPQRIESTWMRAATEVDEQWHLSLEAPARKHSRVPGGGFDAIFEGLEPQDSDDIEESEA